MIKKIDAKINFIIKKIDSFPLWIMGFFLFIVVFWPYVRMGTASVFPWHDQLDENILNYVLTARHFGQNLKILPEMMSGINASALQPFAPLFVPLYYFFNSFTAFVLQYAFVFIVAFGGMYFCVKEISDSNILSCILAVTFSLLPFWPVYGCAVAGIPMVLYAIINLARHKKLVISYVLITIFVLTAHLVFTGYGVLGFWTCFLIYSALVRKNSIPCIIGYFYMIVAYIIENIDLFKEMLFGEEGYVSHRAEFVNSSLPFSDTVDYFINGGQHDQTFHKNLIIPIIILIILGLVFYKKLSESKRKVLYYSIAGFVSLILIALWRVFWRSEFVTIWRNKQDNIFRYFNFERFFWLCPAAWLIEFLLCIYIFWEINKFAMLQIILVLMLLFPTAKATLYNSYYFMSVNQQNNGSGITGYITWEAYYSDDVMSQIEDAIGKDMTTYRVAHVGMNPTPALMHGFYTIDGYAGTYPLEYKHKFRKIMEKELEIFPEAATYYDKWGSRCYLFNSQCGNAFMLGKASAVVFNSFQFDWDLLKEMGCEYIFSGGEMSEHDKDGLEFVGNFTSDTSYWNVWVYKIL